MPSPGDKFLELRVGSTEKHRDQFDQLSSRVENLLVQWVEEQIGKGEDLQHTLSVTISALTFEATMALNQMSMVLGNNMSREEFCAAFGELQEVTTRQQIALCNEYNDGYKPN